MIDDFDDEAPTLPRIRLEDDEAPTLEAGIEIVRMPQTEG